MAIRSPVAGLDLTAEEEDELCRVLGGAPGELDATLAPYATAALREFVDMFTGKAVTNVPELRQRRMVNILLALPNAEFPTDDQISKLFGMTTSAARAFLKTTLARNRNKLRAKMATAARDFIAAAALSGEAGSDYEARFPNAVVIDMLNDQLASVEAVRSPIRRKTGTFDTYIIANGSMIELRDLYQ